MFTQEVEVLSNLNQEIHTNLTYVFWVRQPNSMQEALEKVLINHTYSLLIEIN